MRRPDRTPSARRTLLEQRIAEARLRALDNEVPTSLDAADGVQVLPLASPQRSVWWYSQLAPDRPIYNEVARITKKGPLVVHALRAAVNALVERYDAWRTTFELRE